MLGGPRKRGKPARFRAAFPLFLFLSAWLLPLAGAQPVESLGVAPTRIVIEEGIAGETYAAQVLIQNMFPSAARLELSPEGPAGAWTTATGGNAVTVPARTEAFLDLRIAIPKDAPGGTRLGFLRISALASDTPDGTGTALRTSVAVLLSITVGGEPFRRVVVRDVDPEDVEEGTLPRIHIRLENEGNVAADEEVIVRILDEKGNVVREIRTTMRLLSGQDARSTLTLEEPLPAGQYKVAVMSTESEGFVDAGSFEVVAPGTLGIKGRLVALVHATEVTAGKPMKVVAIFANVGERTIVGAKFRGELALGDEIVEILDSETDLVVLSGDRVNITMIVTPKEAGVHTITGRVLYERSQTAETRSSFVAVSPPAGGSNWGFGFDLAGFLGRVSGSVGFVLQKIEEVFVAGLEASESAVRVATTRDSGWAFWPWWIPPAVGVSVYLWSERRR